MQLTREGDYGIRSILYLARQPYKKISFVTEIAEEYKIPRSFEVSRDELPMTSARKVKRFLFAEARR